MAKKPAKNPNSCPFCGHSSGHTQQCNFAVTVTKEDLEAKQKREFLAKKKFENSRSYKSALDKKE